MYARRAAELAMGMCAYEEAAAEYQRALQALKFVGPDELLAVSCCCGWVLLSRAGNYQQAKESCLQAADISRRLGTAEQLARAALGFGERQVEGGLINQGARRAAARGAGRAGLSGFGFVRGC